jgi:hypothetical protein
LHSFEACKARRFVYIALKLMLMEICPYREVNSKEQPCLFLADQRAIGAARQESGIPKAST